MSHQTSASLCVTVLVKTGTESALQAKATLARGWLTLAVSQINASSEAKSFVQSRVINSFCCPAGYGGALVASRIKEACSLGLG